MSTKSKILEILELNRGKRISGEYLALVLCVSRNAVLKAVNALRGDGYQIGPAPNGSYVFAAENDIISPQGIGVYQTEDFKTNSVLVYETLESTNNTAKEMVLKGAVHGTVIIADSQSGGRGRFGRPFFSPPACGLYISLILRPERLWHNGVTLITAYAAVVVCEALYVLTGKEAKIKWVNDIFIDGKKVSGILSEAVTDFESSRTEWVVVGIGINCKEPADGYPQEYEGIIGNIGLGEVKGSRNRLAAEIIRAMVCPDGYPEPDWIISEYRKRLMYRGEEVIVNSWDGNYVATVIDVNEDGHLLVRDGGGKVIELAAGEISIKEVKS